MFGKPASQWKISKAVAAVAVAAVVVAAVLETVFLFKGNATPALTAPASKPEPTAKAAIADSLDCDGGGHLTVYGLPKSWGVTYVDTACLAFAHPDQWHFRQPAPETSPDFWLIESGTDRTLVAEVNKVKLTNNEFDQLAASEGAITLNSTGDRHSVEVVAFGIKDETVAGQPVRQQEFFIRTDLRNMTDRVLATYPVSNGQTLIGDVRAMMDRVAGFPAAASRTEYEPRTGARPGLIVSCGSGRAATVRDVPPNWSVTYLESACLLVPHPSSFSFIRADVWSHPADWQIFDAALRTQVGSIGAYPQFDSEIASVPELDFGGPLHVRYPNVGTQDLEVYDLGVISFPNDADGPPDKVQELLMGDQVSGNGYRFQYLHGKSVQKAAEQAFRNLVLKSCTLSSCVVR